MTPLAAYQRMCREAGGRVTTNVMMRDLDFPVYATHRSRLWQTLASVRGVQARTSHHSRVASPLRWHTTPRSGCEPVSCARLAVDDQWRAGHSWVVKRFLWC